MDIDQLRDDTPGTKNVIHFNNAGASLMPKQVSEATISYLKEESAWGGYETANKYSGALTDIYSDIAAFINADTQEIALLENATVAWNMAFFSIGFEEGDRILTSVSEYASNYISYLKLQQNVDVSIEVIPNDHTGQTSPRALANMIDEHVKLISITHIPTNSGLVNPVEEIGQIAKQYPCLYLVDACQSVGQYPVDVRNIGCDMLSATGRKYLRGPRGTGFLFVRKDILPELNPPFLDLHSAEWVDNNTYKVREDARKFENWESNYAGVIGLKEAVNYAADLGINNIWKRIVYLGKHLRNELSAIPGIAVRDIGSVKGGIVTFTADGIKAGRTKEILTENQTNVSISGQSSTLLDMKKRNLNEVVRASLHYYNTEEEIETFIQIIKKNIS